MHVLQRYRSRDLCSHSYQTLMADTNYPVVWRCHIISHSDSLNESLADTLYSLLFSSSMIITLLYLFISRASPVFSSPHPTLTTWDPIFPLILLPCRARTFLPWQRVWVQFPRWPVSAFCCWASLGHEHIQQDAHKGPCATYCNNLSLNSLHALTL